MNFFYKIWGGNKNILKILRGEYDDDDQNPLTPCSHEKWKIPNYGITPHTVLGGIKCHNIAAMSLFFSQSVKLLSKFVKCELLIRKQGLN